MRRPGIILWPLLASFWFLPAFTAQAQETGLGPVPVGMTVRAEDDYYIVFGATASELRQAMRESGPLEDGRRWDGHTRWNIRWRYRYAMRSGMCRMTDVAVEYSPRILLPRWNAPPNAPAMLRQQWDDFVRALRGHEEGHRNIGAEAARETLRRIRRVTASSCALIAAEANALGNRTVDEYRARQRKYDEETGHGRSQGASWPPR